MARGGKAVDEPLKWFDALPAETVAFWEAYARVEPFGMDWDRHAQLCNLIDCVRVMFGEKGAEPKDVAFWMPPDWLGPEKEEVPIGDQLERVAKMFPKAE